MGQSETVSRLRNVLQAHRRPDNAVCWSSGVTDASAGENVARQCLGEAR